MKKQGIANIQYKGMDMDIKKGRIQRQPGISGQKYRRAKNSIDKVKVDQEHKENIQLGR